MKSNDRTRRRTSTRTPVTQTLATIPMPGRLAVDYYDDLLRSPARGPLDERKDGTHVTATGMVTRVRHLDPQGGRLHVVLVDNYGDSALVDFGPDDADLYGTVLTEGAKVTVSGRVRAATTLTPAGIVGYGAKAAR